VSKPARIDPEVIRKRFDQALGKEASELIFKTLRMVHMVDEQTIGTDRELFEEKIKKVLGPATAEVLLKKVFEAP
jgi:hypothetical protein